VKSLLVTEPGVVQMKRGEGCTKEKTKRILAGGFLTKKKASRGGGPQGGSRLGGARQACRGGNDLGQLLGGAASCFGGFRLAELRADAILVNKKVHGEKKRGSYARQMYRCRHAKTKNALEGMRLGRRKEGGPHGRGRNDVKGGSSIRLR